MAWYLRRWTFTRLTWVRFMLSPILAICVSMFCGLSAWNNEIWLIGWLIDWLIDWLVDWLIDWLIDRSIDWLIDRLIGWLIDWLIGRSVDWWIDWLIDRSGRSIVRSIGRSIDRSVDRSISRSIGRSVDWLISRWWRQEGHPTNIAPTLDVGTSKLSLCGSVLR